MSSVPATYKAYVYESYGLSADVLKVKEVPSGAVPTSHVRIKVHSASINPVDYVFIESAGRAMTGGEPTKEKPYRFGFDVAGTVVEAGAQVDGSRLKVGDQVYAMTPFSGFGTVAEYIDIDQQYVALKPKTLDFDHAASVPLVALTSYQGIYEHAKVQAGQRVLVIGGSSSTGAFAIQYAKAIGAYVVATTSAKNVALVKSLGADQVIDYHTQKWADVLEAHSLDVIYDCGMEPNSWNGDAQTALKKQTGQFVTLLPQTTPVESKYGAKNHGQIIVYPSARDLEVIGKLIDQGKVKTIVDSVVSFDNVLEGVARVQSRRAVGKVVVKVL